MLPVVLDLTRFDAILIGDSSAAAKRLALLDEAGATRLDVYSIDPGPELDAVGGHQAPAPVAGAR